MARAGWHLKNFFEKSGKMGRFKKFQESISQTLEFTLNASALGARPQFVLLPAVLSWGDKNLLLF